MELKKKDSLKKIAEELKKVLTEINTMNEVFNVKIVNENLKLTVFQEAIEVTLAEQGEGKTKKEIIEGIENNKKSIEDTNSILEDFAAQLKLMK